MSRYYRRPAYSETPKIMPSKYAGTCPTCQQPFAAGETIAWSRSTGARHPKCAGIHIPTPIQDQRAPCWDCGNPEGRFRPYGAATPVYCDTCHATHQAKETERRRIAAEDAALASYVSAGLGEW